jgi:UDP-4-amino-4,6-dideoxy-N-acetyl-beta-L-altrosamine N-acetyltransferase
MSGNLGDRGHLRLMVDSDLENILKMRNHPDIRRYMITQHEISFKEHELWFEKASNDKDTSLYVFDIDKLCVGFVQFKKTCNPKVADWGFFLAPSAPKGSGRGLGRAAIFQGFEVKKFDKICGQVLDYNHKSISFHKSLGFISDDLMQRQLRIGEHCHNILSFSLHRNEWNKFKLREMFV